MNRLKHNAEPGVERFRPAASALGLSISLLLPGLVSGCGEGPLGGGARLEPSVRVLVNTEESETGEGEETVEVAGYGTLTGRVVVVGDVPPPAPFLPGGELKDPTVCIRGEIPNETLVVDPASKGIQNVFVYLGRKPPGTPVDVAAPPAETVVFDQLVCTFRPHALVLQAGQEMRILNSDSIVHNTHTNPTVNAVFNQAIKAHETEGIPVVYSRPERSPVKVICDFHPWMLAWHLPLDHPYGAVTVADGTFTIADIPAGSHQFAIWHEGRKLMDYPVDINPDQTTTVEIPIQGDALLGRVDMNQLKTVVFSALP